MSRVTESRFLSNMASVSMHITRTNMVPTMATYQSSSVVVFTFITCGHIRPWKRKRITPLSKENGSYCTYCHKAKSKHLMNHGMNMALRPLISQICLSTHRAPAAPCSCYCSCLCCFDLAPLPCPTAVNIHALFCARRSMPMNAASTVRVSQPPGVTSPTCAATVPPKSNPCDSNGTIRIFPCRTPLRQMRRAGRGDARPARARGLCRWCTQRRQLAVLEVQRRARRSARARGRHGHCWAQRSSSQGRCELPRQKRGERRSARI